MEEERLRRLEARVEEMTRDLASVRARLASLEQLVSWAPPSGEAPPSEAVPADRPHLPATRPADSLVFLSHVGKTFLILGGALLLRALADFGLLPPAAAVALGLAYTFLWIFLADRRGAAGRRLSASFLCLSAALIGYPFLYEACTRFGILSPQWAGVMLGILMAGGYLVSVRWHLKGVTWVFTLAGLGAIASLLASTSVFEFYTLLLLTIGLATVWIGYGRRWLGPRWIVAIAADLLILVLVLIVTTPRGLQEPFTRLTPAEVQALALGLLVIYLGSFSLHALTERRDVGGFEGVQSIAVLLVGFGGAAYVARMQGTGTILLGTAALLAGAASYAVGFAFVRQKAGRCRSFYFYTTVAMVLVLAGTPLLAGASILAPAWALLAAGMALLGGRFNRVTLRAHSAAFAFAAALEAGWLPVVAAAFVAPAAALRFPGGTAVVVLVLVAASYAVLTVTRNRRPAPEFARIPRFVLSLVIITGVASMAGLAAARPFSQSAGGTVDSGAVATARTAILAAAAIALAGARRRTGLSELGWPVYPILVLGGIKLLLEDVPDGRPATLFLAFACFGIALIVAPRLLRMRTGAGSTGRVLAATTRGPGNGRAGEKEG